MGKEKFYIQNSVIENVQRYKYLGVVLSASGSFSDARINMVNKAKKALFKLKGCIRKSNLDPHLGLKMFDQLIKPICMYGSEVWSSDLATQKKLRNQNFVEEIFCEQPIEQINLSMCKFLLGVNKKAGNMPCRGELGRLPLGISIIIMIFKYYHHLLSTEYELVKDAFIESTELSNSMHHSWISFIKSLENSLKINCRNIHTNHLKREVTNKYKNYWSKVFRNKYLNEDKGKFTMYAYLKQDFNYEPYLSQIKNRNYRVALTKLRISNHTLNIEKGRYQKPPIPRDERFCSFCSSNNQYNVEDEIHFLIKCPKYNDERNKLFNNPDFKKLNQLTLLSDKNLFYYCLNTEGKMVNLIAKFCFDNLSNNVQ